MVAGPVHQLTQLSQYHLFVTKNMLLESIHVPQREHNCDIILNCFVIW